MLTDNVGFRYAGIDPCEICNGIGFGVTLFTQGCSKHCEGCHNPSTWDFNGGLQWNKKAAETLYDRLSKPYITRLTISGGEPFESHEFTKNIAMSFKDSFPTKRLWVYTGKLFEDLIKDDKAMNILKYVDVLVDGQFILRKRDITLAFRGSTNQRIIDVQTSIVHGLVLWQNGAY